MNRCFEKRAIVSFIPLLAGDKATVFLTLIYVPCRRPRYDSAPVAHFSCFVDSGNRCRGLSILLLAMALHAHDHLDCVVQPAAWKPSRMAAIFRAFPEPSSGGSVVVGSGLAKP